MADAALARQQYQARDEHLFVVQNRVALPLGVNRKAQSTPALLSWRNCVWVDPLWTWAALAFHTHSSRPFLHQLAINTSVLMETSRRSTLPVDHLGSPGTRRASPRESQPRAYGSQSAGISRPMLASRAR